MPFRAVGWWPEPPQLDLAVPPSHHAAGDSDFSVRADGQPEESRPSVHSHHRQFHHRPPCLHTSQSDVSSVPSGYIPTTGYLFVLSLS